MSSFILKIATDNDAFDPYGEGGSSEVARILRAAADAVLLGGGHANLRDINGNTVGDWTWSDE